MKVSILVIFMVVKEKNRIKVEMFQGDKCFYIITRDYKRFAVVACLLRLLRPSFVRTQVPFMSDPQSYRG